VSKTTGADRRVRVAKRAIHKLALLPINNVPIEEIKAAEAFNGTRMLEQ